jgi:hypothetical protein
VFTSNPLPNGNGTHFQSTGDKIKIKDVLKKGQKLPLYQAVEAHMVGRSGGSHIFYTVGSQMAVRL